MTPKTEPRLKISGLNLEMKKAFRQIDRFVLINNIKIKYDISFDYNLDCYGLYWPINPHKKTIFINPNIFKEKEPSQISSKYYLSDYSLQNVIFHEFIHLFLAHNEIYLEEFKGDLKERPSFNKNSASNWDESICESLCLYSLNGSLLKIINPILFKWFSERFHPINPCTHEFLLNKYKKWSKEVKNDLKERHGVYLSKGKLVYPQI